MVGKYLGDNCLHIKRQDAADALFEILDNEPAPTSSDAKCNKSHEEVVNFLIKSQSQN